MKKEKKNFNKKLTKEKMEEKKYFTLKQLIKKQMNPKRIIDKDLYFEYFTPKQLIKETDRDYFFVTVDVRIFNPETSKTNYIPVDVRVPFEDAINLENEYGLSDDGVEDLESDLFEYAEKDKDELLKIAEKAVLEDFPNFKILSSRIVGVSLPDVMYEYLDELMGKESEKKEEDLLPWQKSEPEEEFEESKKSKIIEKLLKLKKLIF